MRLAVYLIAILLLYIQQGCMGVPVDTDKGVQYIYSYLGYIDTRSSACDERIARWSITGNLTAQSYDDYWIFQLDNLKTSLFNGPKADINLSHDEDAPKEAHVLRLPFIFNKDLDISVNSEDPLWSVNLKRGIASNFHKLVEGKTSEKTVFGECETVYELKDKSNVVKTINHESCKDKPDKHESNVRTGPVPDNFKPVHRETVIEIKSDAENAQVLRKIHSVSRLTYQPMFKSPNSQHIDQHLELDLVSLSSDFTRINTDELTLKTTVIFQFDEYDLSNGRHVYDDAEGLTQEFFTYYDNFEKYLEATPIENRKNATDEPMAHMYNSLVEMPDVKDLKNVHDAIVKKANQKMYSTFMSLLPYLGTNNSVKFIKDLHLKGEFEKSPIHAIRLLAIFPIYINEPTDELVNSLEGLLNVENVKSDSIKNSQILSFASVVGRAYEKETISADNLKKYTKLYHDKYLESEHYEEKMMYLLGLINMDQELTTDFIVKIIIDKSQSANLRSLALAGFKGRLLQSNPMAIFDIFWSMVKDKKENFEIRVQSLDYLLSSGIPPDQFKIIFEEFKKLQADDIHDKHLTNYFLTSLESYYNTNSNLRTAALNEQFPIFSHLWATGNYRLSYSDTGPSIGEYVQAQLIANPVVNTISTAQFSFRKFAFSLESGVYSVYLKLHGAFENFYTNSFISHITKDTTVSELLKLIKDFDFKMKKREQELHIEIVVFVDRRAVYAMHMNSENKDTFQSKRTHLSELTKEFMEDTFIISFPVKEHTSIPSVLGTSLGIKKEMQLVTDFGYSWRRLQYKLNHYRSSWNFQTALMAYNPLVSTTISSYKYYGDEIGLQTGAFLNLRFLAVSWAVKQDSFNRVWDNLIGTSVEHEPILKRFCADCDAMHEIPTNLNTHNKMKEHSNWGMQLNYTIETNSEEVHKELEIEEIKEFMSTHNSNANVFPYAKPLLGAIHYIRNKAYVHSELQRGSYRSVPIHKDGVGTVAHLSVRYDNTPTLDPFEDTHNNFTINIINKKNNEKGQTETINDWTVVLELKSTHNHKDEHGKDKVKMVQNMYYHKLESNNTVYILCASRVELLPAIRNDKFSLLPAEETTVTTVIRQDHNPENQIGFTCTDNKTITLTESYIVTDEINNKVKESADYKECQKESKGLSFTPPTKACLAAFKASSQYNEHEVYAELKNINDTHGHGVDKSLLFKSTRKGHDKILLELFAEPFVTPVLGINDPEIKYFKYVTHFPYQTKHSAVDNDDPDLRGSCIVTGKSIRSFTGHNIPIDGSKQVAFVECIENPRRGMTIEKMSDNHVGFKLWSRDNIIDATAHGGKIKIALNGNDLLESYSRKNTKFSVRFLDKNVVVIADDKITVYYNTEYIYIKANPIYNDLICGVCSQV